FMPNPFGNQGGGRLYRTGDLARCLHGGELEFVGRADSQVKIRGFRVELGEIESVLANHSALREAAVVVREDTPGDKRLVAYVATGENERPATEELRRYLSERLPEYMVPATFVY